jgi:site-specific recombinase XerD
MENNTEKPLLDKTGRPRSVVTLPGFRQGVEPVNKGQTYDGVMFEPAEILRLLGSIKGNGPAHHRNRAILAFAWRSGIRVTELLAVRESDLDESSGYVRIRRTENRKERQVFLFGSRDAPDWCWQQLRPWLERRASMRIVRSAPLFCVCSGVTKGDALKSPQLRVMLKKYVSDAGLHGRFPLSGFRNTLARELYENDLFIGQIQQQLGHSSLSVTQDFLERLSIVAPLADLHTYKPAWRSDDA